MNPVIVVGGVFTVEEAKNANVNLLAIREQAPVGFANGGLVIVNNKFKGDKTA